LVVTSVAAGALFACGRTSRARSAPGPTAARTAALAADGSIVTQNGGMDFEVASGLFGDLLSHEVTPGLQLAARRHRHVPPTRV
jgi:hypothetical protein